MYKPWCYSDKFVGCFSDVISEYGATMKTKLFASFRTRVFFLTRIIDTYVSHHDMLR
jgi:hypothetical protein